MCASYEAHMKLWFFLFHLQVLQSLECSFVWLFPIFPCWKWYQPGIMAQLSHSHWIPSAAALLVGIFIAE